MPILLLFIGFPINMTSPEPLVLPLQTAPPEEPIPAAPYPNVRITLTLSVPVIPIEHMLFEEGFMALNNNIIQ